MPNLLGQPTEQELSEASAIGGAARNMFPDLLGRVIFCGQTAWLTPPGAVAVKLSPAGAAKLLDRIADAASENLRRKKPSLSGESGRYFRSALGIGCRGAAAPQGNRVCPACEVERLLAPLSVTVEDLLK